MTAADLFSCLPDDLLVHIIDFLSARDAARTSVLSRRWRPLWLTADALNLDSTSYGSGPPNRYSRSYGGPEACQLKDRLFSDAGSALRAEGRCPVTKLSLFVKGPDGDYCDDVMTTSASRRIWHVRDADDCDLLADLLAVQELRRIQELRLRFYSDQKDSRWAVYTLDPAVLPCSTLRVLDLDWTQIKLPQGGGGGGGTAFVLPRLAALRLRRCSAQMEDLEDFIHAAPSLDSLHIECHVFPRYRSTRSDNRLTLHCPSATSVTLASLKLDPDKSNIIIELDAPCLRNFKYTGKFADFSMKSPAPELARVELAFIQRPRPFYDEPVKPWFGPFWQFIRIFRHTKILRLKVPNLDGIALHKDVQDKHLVTLPGLERLELEGPYDESRREDATSAVANLLHCCPVMNSLKIRIINPNDHFGRYRHGRKPLPDFCASLDLFKGRYSKKVTAMIDASATDGPSEVAHLPGLSGCEFGCLQNHLKNVELEFELKLKEMNTFEVCLAKFFAENCPLLENLQIDDGKRNFLSHINGMVHKWRADALEQRKRMEQDSVN